jgi:hypothetical protein
VLVGWVPISLERINQSAQARREHDQITGTLSGGICVRDTCGHKYRRSWTNRFGSVGIAESQLALQDVPRFVIEMVDVKDCRAAAPPLMDAKRSTSCGKAWHVPIVLLNQRRAVLFRRTFPVFAFIAHLPWPPLTQSRS